MVGENQRELRGRYSTPVVISIEKETQIVFRKASAPKSEIPDPTLDITIDYTSLNKTNFLSLNWKLHTLETVFETLRDSHENSVYMIIGSVTQGNLHEDSERGVLRPQSCSTSTTGR